MRISMQTLPSLQFEVKATCEEYDASPPVESLLVDRTPRIRQHDREAVAAYLAFGPWAGAGLTMPGKISPATAAAIRADSGSINLDVSPLEYYPKALPIGEAAVSLTQAVDRSFGTRPEIAMVPSDNWNGALATKDSLVVGTNAFVLDGGRPLRPYLAVATLFAADVRADSFDVTDWGVDLEEQSRLQALLAAVRIGVQFSASSSTPIDGGAH